MQGTLNEIDIRSILQLIELGQRTGELSIEAYSYASNGAIVNGLRTSTTPYQMAAGSSSLEPKSNLEDNFWFVFCLNGQIVYAAERDGSLSRLRDYLHRYQVETALDQLQTNPTAAANAPEYGYLWALLETHVLTPAQVRSIIYGMVSETLFDLLSLHQGCFRFVTGPGLSPQLNTWEIGPLATKIVKQIQEWKQFHPHIYSPHQRPAIVDPTRLSASLPLNAFQVLENLADGSKSLRQLSRYLHRDLVSVTKAIYPYIQKGWVQMLCPERQEAVAGTHKGESYSSPASAHVVCIEDDASIGKAVEYILSQSGYKVTLINNPLEALSLVFKLKPDLILCDLTMPELDGYEVCAMLRQSTAFRQTPIVMLTAKDGFIDRVKARMVRSTDYLTKPFTENELLMLVERYIWRDRLGLKANRSARE
ncbi:MAG: response regulator [Cyanosarcina radialis HA8281-LM2]|jgi:twitching motility two-component system response regulator PilG|nr:response regulator [Cyanosarcina radialis HA8281-LM2]